MRIIIAGYNSDQEQYGRETELAISLDVDDEYSTVTFQINHELVCVQRSDLAALLKLL